MRSLLFIALLSSSSLFGQLATFEWDDECCHVVGTFDSTEVSRVQLQDALDLFGLNNYTRINNTPLLFKPYSLEEHQSQWDAYKIEEVKIVPRIMNCSLPEGTLWEKALNEELEELHSDRGLYFAEYIALLENDYTYLRLLSGHDQNPLLEEYVEALTGTDEVFLAMFEQHTKRMAAKNGDPQRIFDQAKDLLKEKNWRELASINMLTYGWHNEANQGIKRHEEWKTYQNLFLPLFKHIEYTDCCEL
jgi:hypothetical protein